MFGRRIKSDCGNYLQPYSFLFFQQTTGSFVTTFKMHVSGFVYKKETSSPILRHNGIKGDNGKWVDMTTPLPNLAVQNVSITVSQGSVDSHSG